MAQGWREHRAEIVTEAIREGLFDREEQPEDLSTDIQQISTYREAHIGTVVTRLEREDDGRQKWGYSLKVACQPLTTEDWQEHQQLFTELKIANKLRHHDWDGDQQTNLDMDWVVEENPASSILLNIA